MGGGSSGAMDTQVTENNIIKGTIIDSKTKAPIAGAFVTLINSRGSLHSTTDKEGKFEQEIGHSRDKDIKIEVAFLGYKLYQEYFSNETRIVDVGKIRMEEDIENLDEAVVQARRILFKDLGDTTVFFPANIQVHEGATMLDALAKMPGVEATENGVKIFGKSVERTYVNGKAIFGENDPMVALNNLDAELVSKVLAYDEFDERDALIKGKHAKKRRVINLVTFDFINQSLNLSATAGIGMDLNRNADDKYRARYLAGISGGLFNEKQQIQLNIKSHNALGIKNGAPDHKISMSGGDYALNHTASLKYTRKLPKNWKISLGYSFDDKNSENKSIKHNEYIDLVSNDINRQYYDTTSTNIFNRAHKASVEVDKFGKKHMSNLMANAVFNDNETNNSSLNKVLMDNQLFSQTTTKNNRYSRGEKYSLFGSNFININPKHSLHIMYDVNYNNGDICGDRIEDSLNRADNKYIITVGNGESLKLGGNLGYTLNSIKAGAFSLNYDVKYERGSDYNIARNINTGIIDSTVTRKMTTNHLNQNLALRYDLNLAKWRFSANLALQNTNIGREDRFPGTFNWGKNYQALLPSLNIGYSEGFGKASYDLSYSSSATAPFVEQVSNKLDYTNPLFLSSGNSLLNQEYGHNLSLSFNKPLFKIQGSYSLKIGANIRNNVIGTKNTFFSDAVYLPEYSYTTTPGAILTTYDNLGTSYGANFSGSFDCTIKQLRPSISLRYNFSQSPIAIGNTTTNVIEHRPTLGLNLMSNFKKLPLNFSFTSNTSYIDSKSPLGISDKAINTNITAGVYTDFLSRMFLDIQANYYLEHSFTQDINRVNDVMLNASIGCRVFKNRRGKVSFTCNDILNSSTAFSSIITAESISKSWTYKNARYFMFTFSYRFSKNK